MEPFRIRMTPGLWIALRELDRKLGFRGSTHHELRSHPIMGIIEWPCPQCGQTQKARELQTAGRLCASCQELAGPLTEEDQEILSVIEQEEKSGTAKRPPSRQSKK